MAELGEDLGSPPQMPTGATGILAGGAAVEASGEEDRREARKGGAGRGGGVRSGHAFTAAVGVSLGWAASPQAAEPYAGEQGKVRGTQERKSRAHLGAVRVHGEAAVGQLWSTFQYLGWARWQLPAIR